MAKHGTMYITTYFSNFEVTERPILSNMFTLYLVVDRIMIALK